ncbi:ferritin-like domain-containing protein [Raoultella terrigena]|uniref:ferritin-like domain-containing protein n=1 Tax=Raoultella terrigena TaxID=577 RepID=UPI00349FC771
MTDVENYHDWLRDAHAMEKQAESMLKSMAKRVNNYPELGTRIEQHLYETRQQITLLDGIISRNQISRSVLKDSMSKIAALGQSIGGMFPEDEIVKGVISSYVFEQFEIACYTSLITAAEKAGDAHSIPELQRILAEERGMADWLLHHIPDITEQYILRSQTPGVDAKR